ncbi:acetyltransferase [Hymenobacter koreensis]|uniref:Acetyltransferase n=1 Tax=Hymenobacter koreensis TaxID=1084523 RepID=A0ABP8IVC7_9BACT
MRIIIFGIGSQAELAYYLFTHDSPHEVVGFCLDRAFLPADMTTFCHLPVVAAEDLSELFPASTHQLHIALGRNNARAAASARMQDQGYQCASYVCSKAQVWKDLVLGKNAFVDQGTRIHPFVTIGDNAVLVGASIGHHATVGHNVLASLAYIGAKSTIGDGCYLGMNCVIREGIRLGKNNIIGAGACITEDTEDNAVFSAPRSRKRTVDPARVAFFRK